MTLNISKALKSFDLADQVELDCGSFDILIRQAAIHNPEFRAAVASRALEAKKKSLAVNKGTMTGRLEDDVELFIELLIVGWGKRPLIDDDGNEVEATPENLRELFLGSREGKVLFSKIQTAAVDDELFVVRDSDLGNSNSS